MASAAEIPRFTPEQYLAQERKAERKSEYFGGFINPLPHITRWHNLIAGNIFCEIHSQFEVRCSEVYASNLRICVSPIEFFTYPDVLAVRDEPHFLDRESDTLLNPTMIVEVLSPLTLAYDRGEKFRRYRCLDSLQDYVIIAQDKVLVERYRRQGEEWHLKDFRSLDDSLRLDSIYCKISLRKIYAKVEFPREESAGF